MAAEEVGEVILEGAEFEGVGLGGAPFFVAAAGFPIGDVALGNMEAALREGMHDALLGEVGGEHAVDQFALGLGEVGDFAVAGFPEVLLMGLDGSRGELEGEGRLRVAGYGLQVWGGRGGILTGR